MDLYKARLIANGRREQHGIDGEGTFSPIFKLTTIHIVLHLAIFHH